MLDKNYQLWKGASFFIRLNPYVNSLYLTMNNDTTKRIKSKETGNKIFDTATLKKISGQTYIKYIVKHVSQFNFDENISVCGDFTQFLGDKTMEKLKLIAGNFCKNRFCPMCAWRKAKKDGLIISILMKYLKFELKKEFIFLTLTTPNVQGFELEEEIKNFNNSFKKLMKRTEVLKATKGYIRKLEVTYDKFETINKELWQKKKAYYQKRGLSIGDPNPTYDTYNPHFHIIIAVNNSYFTQTSQYINQQRWLELWREATGDNSIMQVNVKKVKANDNKEVAELAKYGAKDSDYLTSQEVFDIFYKALKGKQVLTYNGLFKDALALFKDGKLDKYKEVDPTEYVYMLLYKWGFGEYVEQEIRELTEEEYKKVNSELLDEMEVD